MGLGGKAVCSAVNIAGLLLEYCPFASRKIIVVDDLQIRMPRWSYGSVNGQAVLFEETPNLLLFLGGPSVVQLFSINSRAHVSRRPFTPSESDSLRSVRITQVMGMSVSKPPWLHLSWILHFTQDICSYGPYPNVLITRS